MITPAQKEKLNVVVAAMYEHITACAEDRSNLVAMDVSELITWKRQLQAMFNLDEPQTRPLLQIGDSVAVFHWDTGSWVSGFTVEGFTFAGKAMIKDSDGIITRGVNTSYLKKT